MAIPVSEINQTRVLREIWLRPGISRIELASALDLNKSSITKIIQDLLEAGMVRTGDEGMTGPQGGRKPVSLELNPEWGVFAGIEINERAFRISCLDFTGKETVFIQEERKTDIGSLAETADFSVRKLKDRIEGRNILGIGMGIPGMVDSETGEIIRSAPLGISTPCIPWEKLKKKLSCRFYPENDANCCCWGELIGNKNRDYEDFLYVLGEERQNRNSERCSIKPGIGMGLALEGKVYRGQGFGAGEFMSIFIEKSSGSQFSLRKGDTNMLFSDSGVREELIRELGKNIALIANVLNLKKVILGGFFHSFDKKWHGMIEEEIHKYHSYPDTLGEIVIPALYGSKAVSMGAAYLGMENFYNFSGRFDKNLILKETEYAVRTF